MYPVLLPKDAPGWAEGLKGLRGAFTYGFGEGALRRVGYDLVLPGVALEVPSVMSEDCSEVVLNAFQHLIYLGCTSVVIVKL